MKYISTRRRGNIVAMTAVLMIVLVAFVALAVDIGYLYTVRNELQRSADAAAIAATWELIDKDGRVGTETTDSLATSARSKAAQFASLNKVGNESPGLASDDVNVGYMSDPSDPNGALVATPSGKLPNAVFVRVQRTSTQNGQIPLFFARAIGFNQAAESAQATAAFRSGLSGFQMPSDGSNLNILPFALDETTWCNLSSSGSDSWTYNKESKTVTWGGDGIKEVNLFPQGTGSSGNRGTVDIGGSNDSTADIERQILYGINQSDYDLLAARGLSLQLDSSGTLQLNGDTGISAAVKDELATIIGQPRVIPIFRSVSGPGNNAVYTICKWVGVRVMYVKLTGSLNSKAVIVQPCNVVAKGGIYDNGGGAGGSDYVYSPVWLVR
jgi:Flp pilus assembly protein TadG